jgi:hypothetical protein
VGLKKAIVITPTTGSLELVDAVKSVQEQFVDVDHLLVVDGTEYSERTNKTLEYGQIKLGNNLHRIDLPFNTGKNGFYGHRIMAAFGHLINHEYVLFLDQDNYYDPEHIDRLITTIEKNNYDWAYSLRTIVDEKGDYLTLDECESLGKWPTWVDPNSHLIDTSSYCFKTSFYRQIGHTWDFGWGADRRFYSIIKDHIKHTNYGCTGDHSLNYRLGGNEGSVTKEFFDHGNKVMYDKYKNRENFPWLSQSL